MMDKSRQQFEETTKQLSDTSEFELKLKRTNNGLNYADQYVDLMWISWQASRVSLEVELPKKQLGEYSRNKTINECKEILTSKGVKITNGN